MFSNLYLSKFSLKDLKLICLFWRFWYYISSLFIILWCFLINSVPYLQTLYCLSSPSHLFCCSLCVKSFKEPFINATSQETHSQVPSLTHLLCSELFIKNHSLVLGARCKGGKLLNLFWQIKICSWIHAQMGSLNFHVEAGHKNICIYGQGYHFYP